MTQVAAAPPPQLHQPKRENSEGGQEEEKENVEVCLPFLLGHRLADIMHPPLSPIG